MKFFFSNGITRDTIGIEALFEISDFSPQSQVNKMFDCIGTPEAGWLWLSSILEENA